MAVTLKIDDNARSAPRGASGPNPRLFETYAFADAHKMGRIALGVWLGILLLLCALPLLAAATRQFAFTLPLWCAVATLGVLFGAPAATVSRLKKGGKENLVSATQQAPLKTLLGKASKILGLAEPEGFLEEMATPRVRVLPGAVLIHRGALKALDNGEVSALLVRDLVHLKLGYARRLALLDWIETAQPKALLYLAWPVLIYGRLLRQLWLPHAQHNADRLALLIVKDHNLMLAAILKEYAALDPNMQELDVSGRDVSNWIHQRGHIGGSGEEISTQYKLGRAIHEAPLLESRLHKLQNWASSPEFQAALEAVRKG